MDEKYTSTHYPSTSHVITDMAGLFEKHARTPSKRYAIAASVIWLAFMILGDGDIFNWHGLYLNLHRSSGDRAAWIIALLVGFAVVWIARWAFASFVDKGGK